jgi:hypothetical protein
MFAMLGKARRIESADPITVRPGVVYLRTNDLQPSVIKFYVQSFIRGVNRRNLGLPGSGEHPPSDPAPWTYRMDTAKEHLRGTHGSKS